MMHLLDRIPLWLGMTLILLASPLWAPPFAAAFALCIALAIALLIVGICAACAFFMTMLTGATVSLVITLFYRPFWDKYWVPFVNFFGKSK